MNTPIYEETLDDVMRINLLNEKYKDIPSSSNIGIIASLEYIYEANEAYNAFKQFLMLEDIKYFSKHNTALFEDYTIEAKDEQNGILSKAIKILLDWLRKIKEAITKVFKAVQEKINIIDIANKAFIKKYEKALANKDVLEYEGYDYSFLISPVKYESDYISEYLTNTEYHLPSDFYDKMSAMIAHRLLGDEVYNIVKSSIGNDTEFAKAIDNTYKGTKEKRMYPIKDQLDIIKSFSNDKIRTRKLYAENMALLKSMELSLKAMGVNYSYNTETKEKIDICFRLTQLHSNLAKLSFDAYTSNLVGRCIQAKDICKAALLSDDKQESTNESNIDNYNNESLQDIFSSII